MAAATRTTGAEFEEATHDGFGAARTDAGRPTHRPHHRAIGTTRPPTERTHGPVNDLSRKSTPIVELPADSARRSWESGSSRRLLDEHRVRMVDPARRR
jgi:hypothetical protein